MIDLIFRYSQFKKFSDAITSLIGFIHNGTINRFVKLYIYGHKRRILLVFLLMLIAAIMTGLTSYMIKPVVDKIMIQKNSNQVVTISLLLFLFFFIRAVASYYQRVTLNFIETHVVCDMQTSLFKKVIGMDMPNFDSISSGQIITYFTNDILAIKSAITAILVNLIREVLTIACLVIVMMYQNWRMSCVALIVFPLAILPLSRISKKLRKIAHNAQYQQEILAIHVNDVLSGIRTIKSYNGEDEEINYFNKIASRICNLSYESVKQGALSSPMMEVFGGVAIVATLIYGAHQVISGYTTPGKFTSFLYALFMLYRPAKSLTGTNNILQQALASMERVFKMFDRKNTVQYATGITKLDMHSSMIEFENVTFEYKIHNSVIKRNILQGFNFVINSGEKVALVGPSGGGKSTVASLLMRFYDVTEGQLKIGSTNIKDIDVTHLRKNIGYVGQDVFIFEDTVKNNLLYGLHDITNEHLEGAIKLANANFIFELPMGLETTVKDSGSLSGGQKQLITIVRAILKNSPILILDEATSSLDNNLEREVRNAIQKLTIGKTVIIIAHRLSTIIECDKINVISNGSITEYGSHKQLLASNGLYTKLWQSQLCED